jgi:hypothetical protein
MLQNWLMPWLTKQENTFIFQFQQNVRESLNATLQNRRIGRAGPPRSPNLTLCDFFLWGYVEESVFVPPLPRIQVEDDRSYSPQIC